MSKYKYSYTEQHGHVSERLMHDLDALDAVVFTGDQLNDEENRAMFIAYLDRWTKEMGL